MFVKTERRGNVEALRLAAPCRFAVMPDFFADDIAVDATELPEGDVELPGENFLLQMIGRGEAIVAVVWDQREEDVTAAVRGEGEERTIRASRIPYGSKGSVYVRCWRGLRYGTGTTWPRRTWIALCVLIGGPHLPPSGGWIGCRTTV